MKQIKNSKNLTALVCMIVFFLFSQHCHAEAGGGVRGGGGILDKSNGKVRTLESYEFDPTGNDILKLNPETIQNQYLQELKLVDPILSDAIAETLKQLGPVEKWSTLSTRSVPSELKTFWSMFVDMLSDLSILSRNQIPDLKNFRAWDEKLLYPLPENAEFYQISAISDVYQSKNPSSPVILKDSLSKLNTIEKRLIELHEATYSVFIRFYGHTNPLLVRKTIVTALKQLIYPSESFLYPLSEIKNFLDNRSKFFSKWPSFVSAPFMYRNGSTNFQFTHNQYDHHPLPSRAAANELLNRYCPFSISYDFDGENQLIVTSHFKRENIKPNESPLERVSIGLTTKDSDSPYAKIRYTDQRQLVSIQKNVSSETTYLYYDFTGYNDELRVGKLNQKDFNKKHQEPSLGKLREETHFIPVSCNYSPFRLDISALAWDRAMGELEW